MPLVRVCVMLNKSLLAAPCRPFAADSSLQHIVNNHLIRDFSVWLSSPHVARHASSLPFHLLDLNLPGDQPNLESPSLNALGVQGLVTRDRFAKKQPSYCGLTIQGWARSTVGMKQISKGPKKVPGFDSHKKPFAPSHPASED